MSISKVLTIIIPSYNTSSYIDRNVQTMLSCGELEKIEIIFINDGSQDQTAEVAKKYVQQYPASVRLINKENGGHGSTINLGIWEATGKYFKVIDGDDYVDSNELARLVQLLEKLDVDVCVSDFKKVSSISGETRRIKAAKDTYPEMGLHYNAENDINKALPHILATIHGITYRTEMLKEHFKAIKFSEKIFYEDNEYRLFPMMFATSLYLSDCCPYLYVIDQSNQSISIVNQQKRINQLLFVARRMIDFYCQYVCGRLSVGKQTYAQILIEGISYAIFEVYMTFGNDRAVRRKELMQYDLELKQKVREAYQRGNQHSFILFLRKTRFTLFIPISIIMRWKMKIR